MIRLERREETPSKQHQTQETKTNENNENKDTIVVDTPRTYEKC
jgi:hypothetical protein